MSFWERRKSLFRLDIFTKNVYIIVRDMEKGAEEALQEDWDYEHIDFYVFVPEYSNKFI